MSSRISDYFNNTPKPLWKKKVFLIAIAGILGVFIGFFGSNSYVKQSLNSLQLQNETLDKKNRELYAENEQLKSNTSILETDVKVKKEAALALQNQYQKLLTEQNTLNSELKFYEKLLNPQEADKGLRVFDVKHSKSNNSLTFTLAQKIERAQETSGKLQFQLTGMKDGKEESYKPKTDPINFKFKYFQNISLQISLPEGFQAQFLNVELIPSAKKRKKINQTFSWEALSK